ncbi:GEVED domain-containing protein [Barnesiella intestinihominis]|uniref:GEVED domain-containing protein n=2 Tax=Barnesiella intestinihominis TaxID=487174 RepID=UPI002674D859|nr:GEVED domain-containing protein [Barnesiella intestinihominis]
MKKFTVFAAAVALCCLAGNVQAQEPEYPASASTDVFDFTPWNDDKLLELFANAADEGRKYPTKEEFEAAGFNLDLEFSRSHVRPAAIMEDAAKNIVDDVYPTRRLWMNIPTGQGDLIGGYPSAEFNNDVYSMWNYTNLFGAWNHSILQAPGSWADAAHKNGTHMFSGIKFFESWGTDSGEYIRFITTKNEDGSYRYVDALLNALLFLGLDGINYNFEDTGYSQPDVVGFHQALYKRAKEIGFDNFHIGLYTSNSTLTDYYANSLYGTTANGKTADLMLNYAANDFSWGIGSSVTAAEKALGTADGLYAGVWMVTLNRRWTALNQDDQAKKCGVCLWGEHKVSRIFQYTVGNSLMDIQTNYQTLLEKVFSGANRTPLNRPAISNTAGDFQVSTAVGIDGQLNTFCGLASFIPERTAIQGDLPFSTHFTLGNGDFYAYKGKKTLGNWYNMGQQDYVPTYRWVIYQTGTENLSNDIKAEFTHEDAYIGGSALRLKGTPSSTGADVMLYRTKLNVTAANAKAKIAVKTGVEGQNASNLYLILKKFDDNTWLEFPVGDLAGAAWEEKEIALSGISQNDVIEYIGFRVKGSSVTEDYKIMVGKLELSDDRVASAPAQIDAESVIAEVKEETTSSLSVKLAWNVDDTGFTPARKDCGMIYNDEVNIDHFEILYKNGEDGRVSEVGRTSTWSAYVGDIQFENENDDPYIGVRSVSKDLKSYSPVVWTHIERAGGNLPEASTSQYPPTYINTASDGYQTALKIRFVEKLTTQGATQNIDYSRTDSVGGDNYLFAEDNVLKVEQGQEISVYLDAYGTGKEGTGDPTYDNLQFCFGTGYIDWDLNYQFDASEGSDEVVFSIGTVNKGTPAIASGTTFTFTVPEDAAIGMSRLRIVFSDAWFPHPGPTGATNKGFSIDFPVEISGTNTPRVPAVSYTAYRDAGIADEPEGLYVSGIEDVVNGNGDGVSSVSSLYPTVATDVIYFNNVDKAWIYTVDGQLVKYVNNNPESVNVSDLSSAMYVVKMQKGNVVRSQKMFKK